MQPVQTKPSWNNDRLNLSGFLIKCLNGNVFKSFILLFLFDLSSFIYSTNGQWFENKIQLLFFVDGNITGILAFCTFE